MSRSANTYAQSVNLIHSVLWNGEGVTQARGCLRHEAGRDWEVTLYNLLQSTLTSHLITHNGHIYPSLTQRRLVFITTKNKHIADSELARCTTRKRSPCKTLRGRKYTRRNENRKTHPAQGVTAKSRDTYKRSVNMWTVGAQQHGSMSSQLQCVDSRTHALCPYGWAANTIESSHVQLCVAGKKTLK